MTTNELFELARQDWKTQRCRGTMIVPSSLDVGELLKFILITVYFKRDTKLFTTVIVDNFDTRCKLIELINNSSIKEALEDKQIKIFTEQFYEKSKANFVHDILIWYDLKQYSETITRNKWGLVILTSRFSQEDMSKFTDYYPVLTTFTNVDTGEIRVSTPVEETLIDITIPEDSAEYSTLRKYDEYVADSMSIFGDFRTMEMCRKGDLVNNISATDIAYSIAYKNGWNANLDMNIDYNVQLDSLFNPIALQDRAKQLYDIIRARQKLLTDYNLKIEKVYEIVKENKDKKILIISKRGEFANEITAYINTQTGIDICGNYHDKVEPIKATDANGNTVCYKSGAKKGQPRYLGAQAQQTLNMFLFNNNDINVLSASAAPDKNLSIEVDVIIITSPTCNSIESYLYRFGNLKVNNNKLKLYTLYVSNSVEQRLIDEKQETSTHKILNKCEKIYDIQNYSDFSIVE